MSGDDSDRDSIGIEFDGENQTFRIALEMNEFVLQLSALK